MSTRTIGVVGERLAADYLVKHQYIILARNTRIAGVEIDLLAQQGDALVIVEVKTRMSEDYGRPEDAINRKKLMRLRRAATILEKDHPNRAVHIDAIFIIGNSVENHLRNIEIS